MTTTTSSTAAPRRWRRSKVRGAIAAALSAAALTASVASAGDASAYAPPPGAWTGGTAWVNASDAASGGVYWRSAPDNNAYQAISGYGFYPQQTLTLACYAYGGPVGPYGNTLWYFADVYLPPYTAPVGDGQGWVNDHYLDTPGTAANPVVVEGIPHC